MQWSLFSYFTGCSLHRKMIHVAVKSPVWLHYLPWQDYNSWLLRIKVSREVSNTKNLVVIGFTLLTLLVNKCSHQLCTGAEKQGWFTFNQIIKFILNGNSTHPFEKLKTLACQLILILFHPFMSIILWGLQERLLAIFQQHVKQGTFDIYSMWEKLCDRHLQFREFLHRKQRACLNCLNVAFLLWKVQQEPVFDLIVKRWRDKYRRDPYSPYVAAVTDEDIAWENGSACVGTRCEFCRTGETGSQLPHTPEHRDKKHRLGPNPAAEYLRGMTTDFQLK